VTRFGPYELLGLLGRGGMGEVHRAHDHEQGRVVALKLLPVELAADEGFVERFKQESFAAAQLNDPHVIPIHRYGEIDGRLYLDMRLVDGVDLAQLLAREGALSPRRAVHLLGQAAEALDAAHARGLVHRDVKPSNLLVTASDFVYLVDFGTASVGGAVTRDQPLTAVGSTIGTLDYMAPEQLLGTSGVDARADVYSLACVLFEMVTGQRPFPVDGVPALMHAHLNVPPPQVTTLLPHLPAALDRVVARGMAKDPRERYATTGELAADATRAVSDGGAAAASVTGLSPAPALHPPAAPVTHVPPQTAGPGHAPPTYVPPPAAAPPGWPPAAASGWPPAAATPGWSSPPTQPSANRSRGVGGWLVAAVALVVVAVLTGVILGGLGPSGDRGNAAAPTTTADPTQPPAPSPATGPSTPTTGATTPPSTPTSAAPTAPSTAPPTAPSQPAPGDLGLGTPISRPACDSSWVVFLGSATDPATHRSRVADLLAAHPGASYLLTEGSCSSLRQRLDGNLIYAVYRGPFPSQAAACAAKDQAGGDSYVKKLDDTTPADQLWSC
jgi:serine/threonine-protein kinase